MARIEIVTTEHALPDKLIKSYGVEPEKVAETSYFTIFALTIPRSTSKHDFKILDPFVKTQDIVAYEWSRPVAIELNEQDQAEIEDLFS